MLEILASGRAMLATPRTEVYDAANCSSNSCPAEEVNRMRIKKRKTSVAGLNAVA